MGTQASPQRTHEYVSATASPRTAITSRFAIALLLVVCTFSIWQESFIPLVRPPTLLYYKHMKRAELFFTAALVPLDYFTLIAAASVAYAIRFSPWVTEVRPVVFDLSYPEFLQLSALVGLAWIVLFAFAGLYAVQRLRLATEFTRIVFAVSLGIMMILSIGFFTRELFDSRFILIGIWLIAIIFVTLERFGIRALQKSLRSLGIGAYNVVIIGKTDAGNQLHQFFDRYPRLGYMVTGQYADFSKGVQEKILEQKKDGTVDILLVAHANMAHGEVQRIKGFSDIHHLSFSYSANVFPAGAVRPILHTFAGQPVIEIPKTPLDGWGAIYKRGFDIVFSILLIILTLPIQIVSAVILLLERQGGILFRQKRVGQGGKLFRYFKFRSMVKNAHTYRFDKAFIEKHGNMREGTPLFKLKHDPRITRFGHFIRKFSIDELPEFYLVLFGRMSLVGPRPHLPEEVDQYKPHQRKVLTIKPGITGMAQISGRANLAFDDEVQLDMYYIENWSPLLDLIILLKTPIVVLFSRGAY